MKINLVVFICLIFSQVQNLIAQPDSFRMQVGLFGWFNSDRVNYTNFSGTAFKGWSHQYWFQSSISYSPLKNTYVGLSYKRDIVSYQYLRKPVGFPLKYTVNSFSLFSKYYLRIINKHYVFGKLNYNVYAGTDYRDYNYTNKLRYIGYGVGCGYAYFLSNKLSLELLLGYEHRSDYSERNKIEPNSNLVDWIRDTQKQRIFVLDVSFNYFFLRKN